jgi:hypothetical protein
MKNLQEYVKKNDTDVKTLNKLKELATKLTGIEEVQGETVVDVIGFINDNYSGGGSSGGSGEIITFEGRGLMEDNTATLTKITDERYLIEGEISIKITKSILEEEEGYAYVGHLYGDTGSIWSANRIGEPISCLCSLPYYGEYYQCILTRYNSQHDLLRMPDELISKISSLGDDDSLDCRLYLKTLTTIYKMSY